MKLDLKLLSMRFFQAAESRSVSKEGVNEYLLENVLKPYMREENVRYGDIDFDAFEADDLRRLSNYCDELQGAAHKLEQFAGTVAKICPEARRLRSFC